MIINKNGLPYLYPTKGTIPILPKLQFQLKQKWKLLLHWTNTVLQNSTIRPKGTPLYLSVVVL